MTREELVEVIEALSQVGVSLVSVVAHGPDGEQHVRIDVALIDPSPIASDELVVTLNRKARP